MYVKLYQYYIHPDKTAEYITIQDKAAKIYGKHLKFNTIYLNSKEDPTKWIEMTVYESEEDYQKKIAIINEQNEVHELFTAFSSLIMSEKNEILEEDFYIKKYF